MVFLAGRPVQEMYLLRRTGPPVARGMQNAREVVVDPERAVEQWPFRTAADPSWGRLRTLLPLLQSPLSHPPSLVSACDPCMSWASSLASLLNS